MKIKFFLIYVFVGIAFLGVSAWVFLSGGQNAKAIRAKYRLGGILIMAWAMISVASCSAIEGLIDDKGQVMCYDPVEPEPTENIVEFSFIRDESKQYNRENDLCPGDIISAEIRIPTFNKYFLYLITYVDGKSTELQRTELFVEDLKNKESVIFEVPVSDAVTYRGEAQVYVQACVYDSEGKESYGWINGAGNGVTLINII